MNRQRVLGIPGTDAVVDLGGIRTADGRLTQMRRVLRADRPVRPHSCPVDTARALHATGVSVVIDLRSEREWAKAPSHLDQEPGITHHHIPIGGGVPRTGSHTLSSLYWNLLTDGGRAFVAVLEVIASCANRTILVHCHGGRDRTGLVAALLIRLAGVPTHRVLGDQALVGRLTAGEVRRRRERWLAKDRPPEVFDRVNSNEVLALARALAGITRSYGDVPGYLRANGMSAQSLARAAAVLSRSESR